MASPILLLFGAGPNIGHSVASSFLSIGWRVAVVSRSTRIVSDLSTANTWHLQRDIANEKTVPDVFAELREKWGIPSVVIYNGEIVACRKVG
jgi:NADP-dependent 3-hydroxy acid dehydrogenase YdfG